MAGISADVLRLVVALYGDPPEDDSSRVDAAEGATLGQKPSFETILRLFHKRIYSLSYRLLGDSEEAADLTQETFVRAYKAYTRFKGESSAVYPWLCKIAVNGCKNKFREMSRRNRYEAWSLDEPVGSEEETVLPQIGDPTADPAGIVEQRDLEDQIQEAIQELPPEYRVVVILRDMHGLSYKEISNATGLSGEMVKVRLFRGRGVLRRKFAPYLE